MNIQKLSLADTGQFSALLLDYLAQKEKLRPFYGQFPAIEHFKSQIEQKTIPAETRRALHQVLTEQYAGISSAPQAQIDSLLNEKTFTVTTGHQLNVFCGPLYLIYKLVSTINLARKLKAAYPEYTFVPVYWMATEDHDFAEINHFYLFGKKYEWQTAQTGAVGRMNPAEIGAVLDELPEKAPIFEQAYCSHSTLTGATRSWAHALFGDQGLLCLDADHPELKARFRPVLQQELFQQVSAPIVTDTSRRLEEAGYKAQISPRDINLFYLADGVRERIVQNGSQFEVLNTELSFSESEMQELVEREPEKLSPNVLLRPVYQEMILPNLAYIGGPAEIAYWMQLKDLFAHLDVAFPVLIPRNFALVITNSNAKKLEKTGIAARDLFLEENALKRRYLEQISEEPLSVQPETELLERAFQSLQEKARQLDKSLEGFIGAEQQKALKSLENVEKRLKKAEERKQETGINQVLSLKARLFPEGSLQERKDNFLNFYLNNPDFLQQLLDTFDPLDFSFQVLIDND